MSAPQEVREAHSKIVAALARLVTCQQTDEQFEAELLPRGLVMDEVVKIRDAARAMIAHITALESRLADAEADARRYRWLRSLDGQCDAAACVNFNIGFDWIEQHGDELDAAIDAAIAAQEGGDGHA